MNIKPPDASAGQLTTTGTEPTGDAVARPATEDRSPTGRRHVARNRGAGATGHTDRSDRARESRAERFSDQSQASLRTDADRKADALVHIPGRVSRPGLAVNPVAILGQAQDGVAEIRVPMKAGSSIGPVTVREDTIAIGKLVIKNGEIDWDNSRIVFQNSDGTPTDLDGPLWFDGESIYFDKNSDGTAIIRAEVKCFPDRNITSMILGEGVNKAPKSVGDFMGLMAKAGRAPDISIVPGATYGDAKPKAAAATTAAAGETSSAKNELLEALQMNNLQVNFEGTLREGPLRLGDGVVLNLGPAKPGDPAARVKCTGTLSNMHVELNARVRSLRMEADGTVLQTGGGHISLGIDYKDGASSDDVGMTLRFNAFELDNVDLLTPGVTRQHHLNIAHLGVEGLGDHAALTFASTNGGKVRSINLTLPQMELRGVTGELELQGTDGQPTVIRLGTDDEGKPTNPLTLLARLEVDSASKHFLFDSVVDNLSADIGSISLIDTQNFDLTLGGAHVTGSGTVKITSDNGTSRLQMTAAEGTRWNVEAAVDDLKIGANAAGTSMFIDLAPRTKGRLSLDHLDIGSEGTPVFHGDAEFGVVVDELQIRLPGGHALKIDKGTEGVLIVHDMGWRANDESPTIDATVRLNLGANAVLRPGSVPGLQGARVEVDAKTGKTYLLLTAKVDKDGNVNIDAGINLRAFEVETRLESGMDAVAAVHVPEQRLRRRQAQKMRDVRGLAPVQPPPPPSEETGLDHIGPPELPSIQIDPAKVFGAVESADIHVSIPIDRLDDRVLDEDHTDTYDLWIGDDTMGWKASVDFRRGAGAIRADFIIRDGKLQPDVSKIMLDPPLEIRAHAAGYGPGRMSASVDPRVVVRSITVRRDPDSGKLWLEPDDIEIDSAMYDAVKTVVDAADLVIPGEIDLEGDIKRLAGGFITQAVFGSSEVPAQGEAVMAALGREYAIIGPQTIEPTLTPGEPKPTASSGDTPSRPETTSSAAADPLAALLAKVHYEKTDVKIEGARFNTKKIDLGNDQFIKFGAGSTITVTGTPDDFTIEGHPASLDGLNIGGKVLSASLVSGQANVRVHVKQDPNGGEPLIEIEITDLSARGLSATGRTGTAKITVSDATVSGGTIRIRQGGDQDPEFFLDLPRIHGRLTAGGGVSAASVQGGADSITGEINGSITIDNGKLSGVLDDTTLTAEGISFGTGPTGLTTGSLRLRGSAILTTDDDGGLRLVRKKPGALEVDAQITLPDGSHYSVSNAAGEEITLGFGEQMVVVAKISNATFSCVTKIQDGDETRGDVVLDLETGRINGTVRFDADGFSTVGPLSITGAVGSLTNFNISAERGVQLDMRQIDFEGDITLTHEAGKGWVIGAGTREVNGVTRSTLTARAVARDVRFSTDSPEIHLDLDEDAHATFDIFGLDIGGPGGPGISLGNGAFYGVVESGKVMVGSDDSLIRDINVEAGTLVSATVRRLHLGVYAPTGGTGVGVDLDLRIEGNFGDRAQDLRDEGVHVEEATAAGRFRMIIRAITDGRGHFAARSHAIIDEGEIHAKGSTTVKPKSGWERIQDLFFSDEQPTPEPPPG